MAKKITKAVIALAGYGTRFLPATKVQPKEMLPIIDKPIAQYLVEELIASGIQDIIMVTRSGQSSLENHFDNNLELESHLEKNNKVEVLEELKKLPTLANYIYVRQKRYLPYGNGTPLISAGHLIDNDESFVYMFGDDMVLSDIPATKQLIEEFNENSDKIIVGVQQVAHRDVNRYGIVELNADGKTMKNVIEKPSLDEAPSDLAVFGRYILNKQVVDEINKRELGKGNELWLADAIQKFTPSGQVIVKNIDGKWLTTGDPINFLKATVEYALRREDLGEEFKQYVRSLVEESKI